jgi:Ca-activated chloride channel family protein
MRLTGMTGRESRTFTYDKLQFPTREDDNDFLPRLWATRRVGWLMEQIRSNGEQKELRDEVVDLGTRYGIVTPYTSYLAVEASEAANITDGRDRATPADISLGGMSNGRASSQPAPAAAKATTGQMAVQQSKRERAQQETVKLKDDDTSSAVRRSGGKTFYMRDGVWTDSEFKSDTRLPETTLTFASDEYFALLKHEPRLADYFSLGERVIVVLDGRVYRVNAAP